MAQVILTASWGSEANSTTKFPNDGGDGCGGFSSVAYRIAEKWDITTLPTDATVTKVELTITVQGPIASTPTIDIDGYNNDGLADPEADAAATMFTRCAVAGVYVNDSTLFRTTGTKSLIDLGATAVSDVQAARAAGTRYSIALRCLAAEEGSNINTVFDEYTAASTKPTLTITYTPAAGGQTMTPAAIPSTDTGVTTATLKQPMVPAAIPSVSTGVTTAQLLLSTQFMVPAAIPSVNTVVDNVVVTFTVTPEQVGTAVGTAVLVAGAQTLTPVAVPSADTIVVIPGVILFIPATSVGTDVTLSRLLQPLSPTAIPSVTTNVVATSAVLTGGTPAGSHVTAIAASYRILN